MEQKLKHTLGVFFFGFTLAVACGAIVSAQPSATPRDNSNSAKDREEITSILDRSEAAWRTHDMPAFASLFHEDGVWVLWTGDVWTGRRVIE